MSKQLDTWLTQSQLIFLFICFCGALILSFPQKNVRIVCLPDQKSVFIYCFINLSIICPPPPPSRGWCFSFLYLTYFDYDSATHVFRLSMFIHHGLSLLTYRMVVANKLTFEQFGCRDYQKFFLLSFRSFLKVLMYHHDYFHIVFLRPSCLLPFDRECFCLHIHFKFSSNVSATDTSICYISVVFLINFIISM